MPIFKELFIYVDIEVYKGSIRALSKYNTRMKNINSVHYLHISKCRRYLISIHVGNKMFRK